MKVRKKWNRLFAVLLVAVMIFNSQATALLAMDETGTEVITEAAEGSNTQTALEGYGVDDGQASVSESAPAPEEDAANPGTTPEPTPEPNSEPALNTTPASESAPAPELTPAPNSEPAPNTTSASDSVLSPESTPAPDSTIAPASDPALTPDSTSASDSAPAPEGTPSDNSISAPDQVQSDDLQDDQGIAPDDGSINEGLSTEENIAPEQNAQNGDVQSEPEQSEEEKTGSDEDTELSSAQKSESELNAAEEKETESETKTESETESESEVDVVMAEETEPAPVPELDPANEISYDAEVVALGLDDGIMLTGLEDPLPSTLPQPEDMECDDCRGKYEASIAEAKKDAEADGEEDYVDYIDIPNALVFDTDESLGQWHYFGCAAKNVQDGQTIKLDSDIKTIKTNLSFEGRNITLNLNGFTLKSKSDQAAIITVKGGSVTIKNGTIQTTSARSNVGGEYSAGCIHAENNATIVLEDIAFPLSGYNGNGGGDVYQSGGSLIMRNVTGSGVNMGSCKDSAVFVYAVGCTVSMEEVTLTNYGASGKYEVNHYSAACFKDCPSVVMNKISFTGGGGDKTANENKDSVMRFEGCPNIAINEAVFTKIKSASAVICVLKDSVVSLSDSTLSANESELGSVYVGDQGSITIKNTVIEGEAISSGLYIAEGGMATMTSGALFGNRISDVTIEPRAVPHILAVTDMTFPEGIDKNEYKLWIAQNDTPENQTGALTQSDEIITYQYKAGIIQSEEAEIIRNNEEYAKYKTLSAAVEASEKNDVIRLLPDTLGETSQDRTIKVQEKIALKDSVTLELNNQELALSTASTDKATLVIPDGKSLIITGSGKITGGYNNSSTGLNETIQVGGEKNSKASLKITNGAYVNGIKNYGTTSLETGAQVSQIGQYSGQFILNTKLCNPISVLLEFGGYPTTYISETWLTTGEEFEIEEDSDARIDFKLSAMTYATPGKMHFGNWLNKKDVINTLPLIKGTKIKELEEITNILDVPTGKAYTAIITTIEDALVLLKNEGIVYIGGDKADDDNLGYSNEYPVATMEKAIELAQDAKKEICLIDAVQVTEKQIWNLPDGISFECYKDYTGKGPFAKVADGGTLTLQDITLNGRPAKAPSTSALIEVERGGTLILEDGAVLKDNNHDYNTYYTCGGAIENKGGTVEIKGGLISNCQAYNGGAISCDGGKLIMNGGELSDNNTVEAGGAVMLANGAEMELNGGIITRNTMTLAPSKELSEYDGKGFGGGIAVGGYRDISINPAPKFTMNGGEITWNVASECGGGIFVQANAEARIYKGLIDHNTARSVKSGNFSGGGIYVNGSKTEILGDASNDGYLYLENALITGNVARGDTGGGIAACPTASAKVYLLNGAAIYANKTGDAQVDRKKSDILIRRSTFDSYATKIDVSEYMPNGQPYLWKEYKDGEDSGAGKLHRSDYIDQYSLYTDQSYNGNVSDFSVRITNNDGGRAGGGIGTNGTVEIGTKPDVTSISASKVWHDEGHTTARPEQIKVWLLQRKQGESEYKRVLADYLVPDAKGNWGSVTFTDQPIADPTDGTPYEYTVEEDPEDLGPYTSTVEADGDNNWKITNTYTATGTAQVKAKKTLTGRPEALKDQEFSFSLAPVSAVGGADGAMVIEDPNLAQTGVKNAADGTVTFADLTYLQAGTYTYELREEDTSVAGVTKDSAVYTVTVTMTDDNAGHLTPSVTYSKDGSTVAEAEVIFANTYKAKEGTANVSAKKTLTGRPNGLQAGEFEFSLAPVSAVGGADGKTEIDDPNAAQTGVTNAADGAVNFEELTYTETGTYTYELKETSVDGNGVTVDGTIYTVTVTVTDNNAGQLEASVAYTKGTEAVEAKDVVFANTYTAKDGKASVTATKTLTGRADGLQANEFSFTLTPVSAVAMDGETPITDPNMDAATNPDKMLTASNDADGNMTFKELTYTEAGTYTYELKEAATDETGITIDPTVYTVTVSVTDNNEGQLQTKVTYKNGTADVEAKDVVFANTYKLADNSIQLGATKVFDRTLTGDEFTFVLQEVDQDGKAIAAGIRQEKTNDKDGKILFDEISYDKEGTHYYQVRETAGSDPTILSYDATVYTVTVTVKDVDAKLVATPDQTADKVVFTNSSTRVRIDKRDAESGASIPGAVLRVVERDPATGALGAVVEEWTTDGTPHELLGKLSKNGSYELIEVSAPDGYLPTGPVDFTVNENGETVVGGQATDTVVMLDTKNTVSVLKVDEQGAALSGAHLVIENAAGEAVDSWVSDGAPHVTRGLARGHYALSEVEAPSGYHVAEDVPFDITGAETQPVEVQMSDTKIPEKDKGLLTVTKHLHLDGVSCDIGLHEAVFYVALFSDEAKTHRVSDVKAITINDNSVGTATFENLGKGIYYLGETDENGLLMVSKIVNDQVIYYPEYDKSAKVELETRKDEKTAELTNVYLEVPSGFYLAGRLNITKKVLVGGEEGTSEDTFYARVFSDKALTVPASDVIALEMKGAGEASATVYDLPIGETLESSATYYVAETDESGTPLDPDEVTGYEISIDKKKVVLSADNSIQDVVITNDFVEEEETETSAEEGGTTPGSGSTAPKTGDETDYMRYLCYMLLSAGLFGAVAGQRRRKARRVKK